MTTITAWRKHVNNSWHKTFKNIATIRFVLPCLALLLPRLAWAANSCAINTSGISFGPYDPLDDRLTQSTGTVEISCANIATVAASVEFSAGSSGSFSARRMSNGKDDLLYNLYLDANFTVVWGDGSSGTSINPVVIPANGSKSLTVYGIIRPKQNISVGNYSDNITITVKY